MVHLAHDVGGTLVVASEVTEQGSRDGHIKRCRHTLASHVADNEKEFVALEDEVVEVATHLLSRRHRRKEVEVLPLGKGRWNHPHLDIMGNCQLTLQPFFAGCRGLQVNHVLLE